MAITPGVPAAEADPGWTTPERPGTPPVSALVATHEAAPGGQPIASPPAVPDARGDDVATSVAGAMAAAEARFTSHEAATHGQGNQLGSLMDLPEVATAHSKHAAGDDSGYAA